jgi:hypothetical protein
MPSRILVGVQANGLTALAKDLQSITPKALQEMVTSLKIAGDLVADAARSEASWSQRIPGSIKVTGATPRNIKVSAGGSEAPHAYTFEAPDGKAIRHPVFGNRGVWVEQSPRPFLRPALDGHTEEILEIVVMAIDRALLRSGFH